MNEWRYRLLLLAAFLAGIGLTSVHSIPTIFHKIGEALIIAPVLALLVDEAAKTKLLREFSLDVSSHIMGRLLPVPLREHLNRYLQMFLVRTRWDITYDIDVWDGQPGYIRLKTISEYDMENHSENPTDYDFRYSVEESLYPHVGCTQITFVRLGEETYEGDELTKVIQVENDYRTFLSKKELQPHSRPGKPVYSFAAKSEECFRDSAFSPFFANSPVMTAVLSVWYPHEHLRVSLELTFDDVKTATQSVPISSGDRKGIKWTIKKPMLPGQGFVVRWDAIHSEVPKTVATTAPVAQQPCLENS
ncbi:MAG TPA: hypothetical protein VN843_32895 [Anaerolineales bacterium]|nr:hypothetical protein [Anaerolineales bacterium]